MKFPRPLDPYCYGARVHRVIDGDSVKLQLDQGFSAWRLCTVGPGLDKEAPYPQGVYRLSGIDTPELRGASKAAGIKSKERVEELLSQCSEGDSVLVKTNKKKLHGKYRYMVDLFVPVEPEPLPFDPDDEEKHWLSDEDLLSLVDQTPIGRGGTIRALATEILARRQPERSVIHVNKLLVEEGLAVPYFGKKKG